MKCNNCHQTSDILHRTNPKGQAGIFWCLPCIRSVEPELGDNIIEDKDFNELLNILVEAQKPDD
jgi:hypothetical protein